MQSRLSGPRLLVWVMTLKFTVHTTHMFIWRKLTLVSRYWPSKLSRAVFFQKANPGTAIQHIQALEGFVISSSEKITITNFTAVNETATITLHPKETSNTKNQEGTWEEKDTSVLAHMIEDANTLHIYRMDETTSRMRTEASEIIASPLGTPR